MSNTNRYGNWYETEIAKQILTKKYYHEGENFYDFVNRVSSIFDEDIRESVKKAMIDGDFMPGGRVLYGAGSKGKFKATLSNCYILPSPEDNIESIFDIAGKMARIFSMGGGCGVNLSNLRPNGAKVNNSAKTSTGAVSFMHIYNSVGDIIGSNNRRAALLMGLNCTHPDIEEFLQVKQNNTALQSTNISILFTDEFMRAVRDNKPFELYFKIEATGEEIRKTINAREFFCKFCESQYNYAEPGALFIDRIRNYNLLSAYPENEYKIEICNPCVSGDTLILTRDGYKEIASLVGKEVEIWNGYEWSIVQPRITGTNQPMKLVRLSNGMELKCTDYHKFVMKDGSRKQANELTIGDKLAKWDYPVVDGSNNLTNAYTHGFYSGDGTAHKRQICLYGDKKDLVQYLDYQSCIQQESQNRLVLWLNDCDYNKDFVPDSSYTIKSRLEWLAGLLDSDGCLNDIGGSISISSISKEFLSKLQLMLSTLGCHSSINVMHNEGSRMMPDGNGGLKEYYCQESYRLVISASNVVKLKRLGLNTHRVKLIANPSRNASRFITVVEIIDLPNEPVVFCFNEPKNHTGIFNGIMTAQCAEYTGSAWNACCLGSINLYNLVEEPFTNNAHINIEKLKWLTTIGVRSLNNILDYGYDMQPLDENRKAIDDWRAIGLGIFGLGDALIALGQRYGSKEAIMTVDAVMTEMLSKALYTSAMLAKEKGTFGKYKHEYVMQSPLLKRALPYAVDAVEKYGLRNGSLLSIAPTGTIATMMGVSTGAEPLYDISYERTTHSLERKGKVFKVFAKSVSDLMKTKGLDMTEEQLRHEFPFIVTAHDIDPIDRVKLQARMQKYVDNSISSTVNLKHDATVGDIFDAYMSAWEYGCKGLTVFRDGCARSNILGRSESEKKYFPYAESIQELNLDTFQPKRRRDIARLSGVTIKKASSCANPMYVTVNNIDNNIFEVFTNASGGCKANISTITRLVSLALRSGIKVETIIEELKENQCPACQLLRQQGNKEISASCGTCIGEAIEEVYYELKKPINKRTTNNLLKCPACGELMLRPDGKCFTCNNCGYSRCD